MVRYSSWRFVASVLLCSTVTVTGRSDAQQTTWMKAFKDYKAMQPQVAMTLPVSPKNCFMTDPMPPECNELFKKPESSPAERFGKYLKFNAPSGGAPGGNSSCASPADVREAVKVALEDLGVSRKGEVDSTNPMANQNARKRLSARTASEPDEFEKRDQVIERTKNNPITPKGEKDVLDLVKKTNAALKDACKNPTSEFDKNFCWSPQ